MISKLQQLFKNVTQNEAEEKNNKLEIATSVLFLELAYADFNIAPEEEKHMHKSIEDFFSLSSEEVKELVELAREKRDDRNDIWLFTDQIKQNFSRDDKIRILEMLWELVYADGHMDKYEEALMRKITPLLGLSHAEMIQAKLKAKK
ncbi:MAG: TerB family tellurite resistance protein [Calditrichaeota bacterium]|nr:MAG: TerB family tellurite resistance protein [Calditrichota bacterium]MBL1205660.1 TerB family tellurite resistance protein [Calditrichota bacterium]NOG45488.1 TerB family tellurite resistance protein [Calditrichota bacterium]